VIALARFIRRALSRNEDQRLLALMSAADRILPGYRLTWPQMDWWHNPEFNAYLDRFGERGSFNTHRKWMLWQLLRLISDVPGDTAECGVFEGASSWLICAATGDRTHHLFDSFEGLSDPDPACDGAHWVRGALAASEDVVRRNLSAFADRVEFHKGWIPDRFPDVSGKAFAFVHVDVDLQNPTLDSLTFFYPRLAAGGVLLCDDYGCGTCPGATEAVDRFLRDKPERMIALDAGGGFFIKGIATAEPKNPNPATGTR
jgi:hypothetical protein